MDEHGTLLASGGDDKTVGLHDVRSMQLAARFEPHDEAVISVVFIDNGKALVSGGMSGWREVWDVPGRRWLATLRTPGSVALSSQGRRIALRHEDNTITLPTWDAPTLVAEACRIVSRNLSCDEWRQFMGDKPYHQTCEALPSPAPCR
jgi:WD40 repeat protein